MMLNSYNVMKRRLLKLDIELAYFRYGGDFYAQPRGLGMGKSTSSPLSDIFMENFEQSALASFAHSESILFSLYLSSLLHFSAF